MTYSTAPVEDNNTEYGTYYIYWKAVSSLILVLVPSRIASSSCTPQICAPYKASQSCFAGNEDVCTEWVVCASRVQPQEEQEDFGE